MFKNKRNKIVYSFSNDFSIDVYSVQQRKNGIYIKTDIEIMDGIASYHLVT